MDNIDNNIKDLIKEFNKIKNKDLIESLRTGPTGLGYTFETAIGKDEDRSFHPDFKGIEIKTKLGYSKSKMTLFCLTPSSDNKLAIKSLINNYGYPNKNDKNFKSFKGDIFYQNNNRIGNTYTFQIRIENDCLRLYVLDSEYNLLSKEIYWELNEIKNRLETKLQYLAIIRGYPYFKNGKKMYKYTNLNIYKLKDFESFERSLKENIINITFNIDTFIGIERYGEIHDHGTAFKISLDNIDKLFTKIY